MYRIHMLVLIGTLVIIQYSLGNVQYANDGNNENVQENEHPIYLPQNPNYNNAPVNRNVPNGNAGHTGAVPQTSSVRVNNAGNNMAETTTWQTGSINDIQASYHAPTVPMQYRTSANGPNEIIVYWKNKNNTPQYRQRNDFQNVHYQPVQNGPIRIVYQQQIPIPPVRPTYPSNSGITNRNYYRNGGHGPGKGVGYNNHNQNMHQYIQNHEGGNIQGQGQYINHGEARVSGPVYRQRYNNVNYGDTRVHEYGHEHGYQDLNHKGTRSGWNDHRPHGYQNVNPGKIRTVGNGGVQGNENAGYQDTPTTRNGHVQRHPIINSGTWQGYPNEQGNIQNNIRIAEPQGGGNEVQGLAQNPVGGTDVKTTGNNLQNGVTNIDIDRFTDGMDEIIYD